MKYNELLAAQYNDALRALLGLDEQEGVTTVVPELGPVVELYSRIENWRLFGGFPLGGTIEQSAVVGEFSYVTFRNPTGTNLLVVIENIIISNTGANAVRIGSRLSNGFLSSAANVPARLLDRGRATTPTDDNPLLPFAVHRGSQVADPIAEQYARIQSIGVVVPVNHVLSPGSELIIVTDAANAAVAATFLGRARRTTPRERSLI